MIELSTESMKTKPVPVDRDIRYREGLPVALADQFKSICVIETAVAVKSDGALGGSTPVEALSWFDGSEYPPRFLAST